MAKHEELFLWLNGSFLNLVYQHWGSSRCHLMNITKKKVQSHIASSRRHVDCLGCQKSSEYRFLLLFICDQCNKTEFDNLSENCACIIIVDYIAMPFNHGHNRTRKKNNLNNNSYMWL